VISLVTHTVHIQTDISVRIIKQKRNVEQRSKLPAALWAKKVSGQEVAIFRQRRSRVLKI